MSITLGMTGLKPPLSPSTVRKSPVGGIMKNLLTITIYAICTLYFTQSSYAKGKAQDTEEMIVKISSLMSGNAYLSMAQNNRRLYIIGVIDGIELAPMFSPPSNDKITAEDRIKWVENRVETMSLDQIEAVVTKYLQDNPSMWHLHMNTIIIEALMKVPYKRE